MDRRKFILSCTSCAFASMGAVLLNESAVDSLVVKRKPPEIKYVQIHINEHCNLKCKYCFHFSSIADEEYYNLDKFAQDVERMRYIFKDELPGISLMGGEPLLNPDINQYIKISRKNFPNAKINIVTNAVLLDDMDEKFWKTLNEEKVNIAASVYPVKINWKSVLNKTKKYNVPIYGDNSCEEKLTLDNIEKSTKYTFGKLTLKEEGSNDLVHQLNCRVKFRPNTMQDGKLYPCCSIAFIRHLNKKFGTNFKVSKKDYLDLYKIKDINDVKKFMQTPLLPFCKYCNRGAGKVKWENAVEHSVSEWT